MKEPTQCELWEKPELVSVRGRFEVVETFVDESHLSRCLLKCGECGQLYFYEFYEKIDWDGGNDPQYSTYIPVETEADIETLKKASVFELMRFLPRLQSDNRGASHSVLQWMK